MGNPKAREFARRQELAAAWKHAESDLRELTEDVSIPGIGARRIQLVYAPSFKPGYSWDVREIENGYQLYRSRIILERLHFRLSGYEELDADPEALGQYFARLRNIALPIAPDFSGMAGLDGTLCELSLSGDMHSAVRFHWWSEGPDHWRSLITIANEMIHSFLNLPPKQKTPVA